LFWIPPLFLLWLNLHAGFALGPALLLAYGIGLVVEVATGNTTWQETRPLLLRTTLLLLACLVIIPLNPCGTQLYRYPLDTLRSPGMRSFIGEWFSPEFHTWLYRPFLSLWLVVLTVFAACLSRPKGRVLVPLLLTSLAALDAVRHIPIFVLIAIPVVAAALPRSSAAHRTGTGWRMSQSRFRPFFNMAVVIFMALFVAARWIDLARSQPLREAQLFPQRAVEFLQAANRPGRLFAYYDWGGYAIWKLYPQSLVFVDGRADLYGDDILLQFKTAAQLHSGWKGVLDAWNVESVLVPPSSALAQALFLDPGWHTAFSDSEAVILVRTGSRPENVLFSPETAPKGLRK
jgi:hypothetical protein